MPVTFEELRKLSLEPGEHPRGRSFLSAASGLVRAGDHLFVVADDEHHLGMFDADGGAPLRLVRLFEGDLPESAKKRKRVKPDLEALVLLPPATAGSLGSLLALGSGSRPNRFAGALIELDDRGEPTRAAVAVDLAPLYHEIAARVDVVNVEGAFVAGDELVLLQRGGAGAGNAAIRFDLPQVLAWLAAGSPAPLAARAFQDIDLGSAGGVPFAFTDGAALSDGDWLFSAVAEHSDDSYADGPCVAAMIGIARRDGSLRAMHPLLPVRKVEGIDARVEGGEVRVSMVTDDDDPDRPAAFGVTRFVL